MTENEGSLTDDEERELIDAAQAVAMHAHAPYSKFAVGAAARASDGRVFVGCNVENASYPAGLCAERNAIGSMVAAGATDLVAVCIFTDTKTPAMPCGICRQVMREFGEHVDVICATPHGIERATLGELLPRAFRLTHEGDS